jgi:hypothetical protein
MLADTMLCNLKPKDKLYKVNDRDGIGVAITPAGTNAFRYNYSRASRGAINMNTPENGT